MPLVQITALELALQLPECKFHNIFRHELRNSFLLTDAHFRLILQHHCEGMLELQTQWLTPLASAVRYDSCTQEVIRLADHLSDEPTSSSVELCWLQPLVCDGSLVAIPEEDEELEPQDDNEAMAKAPEEVLLRDILDSSDDDDDKNDSVILPTISLKWSSPEVEQYQCYSQLRA